MNGMILNADVFDIGMVGMILGKASCSVVVTVESGFVIGREAEPIKKFA